MTNLKMIQLAFSEFNSGNIDASQKIIARINSNFSLEHDEFRINLDAKVYAPYAETCNELIENDRADLIGDLSLASKKEIKILVRFRTIEPVDFLEGDEDCDIEGQFFYGVYDARIDEEGINSAVSQYAQMFDRKEPKKIIKKWLKEEFGKVNY